MLILHCHFSFESKDGTQRSESGTLKTIGDTNVIIVTGSYSFPGSDGKTYRVFYIADENGYRTMNAPVAINTAEAFPVEPPLLGLPPAALNSLVG